MRRPALFPALPTAGTKRAETVERFHPTHEKLSLELLGKVNGTGAGRLGKISAAGKTGTAKNQNDTCRLEALDGSALFTEDAAAETSAL